MHDGVEHRKILMSVTNKNEEFDRFIEQAVLRRKLPPASHRRAIREQSCMTQHEVGKAVGASRVAICRYESGEREPHGVVRERYALLLDRLRREVLAAS